MMRYYLPRGAEQASTPSRSGPLSALEDPRTVGSAPDYRKPRLEMEWSTGGSRLLYQMERQRYLGRLRFVGIC